ncbi:MAG: 3-oxoacyl-[acyl-carrier-protein] reductase FabG [Alphaproteobacteria bacterium MarineAlpha5_Bin6]|nr:MAG: 3-oxoacyl-[acyl-carrier-protein] reductase FabG [Alphaproteobacteria bacterium MarineAlpha5_Bin6]|tara:strand:- start:2996 stop:3739 length:744 start_codon:yes stop_codon:yes gene_type:complete
MKDNKIALITGGGTGIGLAVAKKLHSMNFTVVLTGRRKAKLLDAKKRLRTRCHIIEHDISIRSSIGDLVKNIEKNIGNIDILINNAGIHLRKIAVETNDEEWESVINTNLNSVFALSRECAKKMIKRKKGNIIMIGSVTTIMGLPDVAAYATTKTALHGLTRSLAIELGKYSINVNCVCPGFIKTAIFNKVRKKDPNRFKKILSRTPLNRFGKVEDISDVVGFLCSPQSKFITGSIIPVDGGFHSSF